MLWPNEYAVKAPSRRWLVQICGYCTKRKVWLMQLGKKLIQYVASRKVNIPVSFVEHIPVKQVNAHHAVMWIDSPYEINPEQRITYEIKLCAINGFLKNIMYVHFALHNNKCTI